MITIYEPEAEVYDEVAERFMIRKARTITLEHSLVSLSKWEAKWKKPFLSQDQKTNEEWLDYFKCMTITQGVDDTAYQLMSQANIEKIIQYIQDPMTATWFNEKNSKPSREIVTSELIYYWMIALNIPFECQKWHLNRLMTLIRVCSIKQQPDKKMNKKDMLVHRAALNAARKKANNSHG